MMKDNKAQSLAEVIVGLIVIIIIVGAIGWFLGSYRIDTGQGAILTTAGGEKIPITDTGWHSRIPLITDLDKYSVVNNNLYFPADYLELEQKFQSDAQAGAIGYDIKTTDDKVVDVGAVMSYEIVDLIQFGVKNTHPQEQMQKAFDAVTFNYLQSQSSEKITNKIMETNAELLQSLKSSNVETQFGIKINSVSLLRPTFTKVALEALAKKQAIQAESEGKLNAAKNDAEAIETIAQAMKKQSDILSKVPENQLDFNARMTLYGNLKGQQNVIWVIDTKGSQPIVLQK